MGTNPHAVHWKRCAMGTHPHAVSCRGYPYARCIVSPHCTNGGAACTAQMMRFTPLLLLRALGGRHLDISPTGTYSAAPLAHPFTFLGVMRPRTVLFLPSAACRASYVDARLARVATAYARQSQDVYTTWFDVTEPLCTLGRYSPKSGEQREPLALMHHFECSCKSA